MTNDYTNNSGSGMDTGPGLDGVAVQQFRVAAMEQFEHYIQTLLSPMLETDPLFPAMKYSLLSGGKRLRPLLCMATAAAFGSPLEKALPAAAATELVHAYSLIHDDLPCMDDDDMRRGRPTNHKVYGEAIALLAGDGLLTHAFEVLTRSQVPADRTVAMVQVLASAAGPYGMVGGQVADMKAGERSLARLRFIHAHKTGRLIQAAIDLGALIGNAGEDDRAKLQTFGKHIGQAFQMMDDWLDVRGTTEELGKLVGHDEALDKLTYPALFGADETLRLAESEYHRGISVLESFGSKASNLRGIAEMMVRRRN